MSNQPYRTKPRMESFLKLIMLIPHHEEIGFLPPIQSGLRTHHSTETALLRCISFVLVDHYYLSLMSTNKFPSFTYSSSVRYLGVILDSSLNFSDHILTLICSSIFIRRD